MFEEDRVAVVCTHSAVILPPKSVLSLDDAPVDATDAPEQNTASRSAAAHTCAKFIVCYAQNILFISEHVAVIISYRTHAADVRSRESKGNVRDGLFLLVEKKLSLSLCSGIFF